MTTTFEKIVARELPSSLVYEGDHVIAFLDIMPANEGHTLVVPKVGVPLFADIPPAVASEMMQVAQDIVRAI